MSDLNNKILKSQSNNKEEGNRSTGYSTDVDTFTRSKKLLALERSWINMIKRNQLGQTKLRKIISQSMKVNFKNYESLSLILEKILCFT